MPTEPRCAACCRTVAADEPLWRSPWGSALCEDCRKGRDPDHDHEPARS